MFKVYKASAGSGKTTSLVAEYLSLCLLEPKKFRHVLAVTFTNNATAEMKERIVKTLKIFAFNPASEWKGSEAAIYKLILRDSRYKSLSENEFRNKSLNLLKEILYDYPNFTISTIDSFFQRIIRSFAFDLGINMNYNVAIDLSDCYDQTVDMLLNKLSKSDKDLSERTFPWVEPFESANIPYYCYQEYVNNYSSWTIRRGNNSGTIPDAHSGNTNAMFYAVSNSVTRLVLPVFDFSLLMNPTLSFWYGQVGGTNYTMNVYYRTSPSDGWTLLENYSTFAGPWNQATLTLPNPSSTYQIAFEVEGLNGSGLVLERKRR